MTTTKNNDVSPAATGKILSHPSPGETKWDKQAPSRESAMALASEHWDVSALHGPDETGIYAVVTRGGYCALVGNIGGSIAILNRETDGRRTLIQSMPKIDLTTLPKTLPGTSGVTRATHCPQTIY